MARELKGQDYQDFLNYFSINFPALRSKFNKDIEWSLTTVPYGTRKPNDMSNEDFDSFREIELRWLIDNGIADENEKAPSFVLVRQGQTPIEIDKVILVEKITNETTRVVIRHKTEMEDAFEVVGDVDFVKKKLTQK